MGKKVIFCVMIIFRFMNYGSVHVVSLSVFFEIKLSK